MLDYSHQLDQEIPLKPLMTADLPSVHLIVYLYNEAVQLRKCETMMTIKPPYCVYHVIITRNT